MSLNNDDHQDISSSKDEQIEQPETCGDNVNLELQNEEEQMSKSIDASSRVIQEEQSEVSLNDEMSHEEVSDLKVMLKPEFEKKKSLRKQPRGWKFLDRVRTKNLLQAAMWLRKWNNI